MATVLTLGSRLQAVCHARRRHFSPTGASDPGWAPPESRIAGYGAPAKGNTLLGFLDLGPGDLDYIADRSPLKQGLYTPGTHIPVVEPERLLADQPDYTLLLAWNFADEVMEQQSEYRRRGGRFILPVPDVRIFG